MDTYYAPALRTDTATLNMEIAIVEKSPVVAGLLQTVNGLLAIVNEQRQVVAVNDSLLAALGFDDPEKVLGLRPGEALACIHAGEEPAGCGTTKYCSTCGAAIAMVTSFGNDTPCERLCALSAKRSGVPVEMALLVKSHPISIDQHRFLLLFLQDVSLQECQAALERTFFHDIKNTLHILIGASDLLAEEAPSDLVTTIQKTADRLINEVAIQKRLIDGCTANIAPVKETINTATMLEDLRAEIARHPAAACKTVAIDPPPVSVSVSTDRALLMRVLCNMSINALEATEAGGTIVLKTGVVDDWITFAVWNKGVIPPEVGRRIFQRYFSTKNQPGRGIGTYSMKLFGEHYLGGKVDFTSTPQEGTVFRIALPPVK